MFDAAAATSAAPLYWNLKDTLLPDGSTEVLLDGGIIQNNPSIYAIPLVNMIEEEARPFSMHKYTKRPFRLISIGTGGSP